MRDLDDPANPYLEQYGEWDRWLLANAKYPTMEEMRAWQEGTAPAGYQYMRPTVSKDGWLIPQLVELEEMLNQQTDLSAYMTRPDCVLSFSSAGVADPAVFEALEQARLKLWAQRLPEVPQWLAAALPKRVIVLPEGGAVTYGPLGSGMVEVEPARWRYDAQGNPEVYYRYDAQGKELGHTSPGQPWQELFTPGYTQNILLEGSKAGLIPLGLNGYTLLRDMSGEVRQVYDYTGVSLPPDTPTAAREGGMVVELHGEFLAKVLSLQS